ncbi:MAG: hypothetical protein EA378_01870 [Phycisphaerales bacterium]|nr:MAG: hypothetical protein EA378_01870 [Phycisphaerales bacterium]
MTRTRQIAAACTLVSAVALIASAVALARGIAQFNTDNPTGINYTLPLLAESLRFHGRDIRVTDDVDDRGRGVVVVTYGDRVLKLPVRIPQPNPLPGLARHADWFTIVRFIEAPPRTSLERAQEMAMGGEIADRLVIVERIPRLEANEGALGLEPQEGWGWQNVQRKNWFFGFHEFKPDGSIESTELRFPTTRRQQAPLEGELRYGTWQYDVAFQVMPKGAAPRQDFTEGALVHAQRPFAAASLSLMALLASLAVASAANGKRSQPAA